MKKKMVPGSLNGLGIGVSVVLAVIMIIHQYIHAPDESLHMRIIAGLFSCLLVLLGTGIAFLMLFFVFYAAKKLSDEIFVRNEEEQHVDIVDALFVKENSPVFIICFVASYIAIFFFY